jgi:NAD(P)-dependent dehydrogenase (short-subunit alcohol dehydrogenase family)
MNNLFDLKNKVALITGSSSGMGKAIAYHMGLNGAKVIISSNEPQACQDVLEEFLAQKIDVIAIPCNLAVQSEIDNLVKKAGKIDILVNGVGIATSGSFLDINAELFEQTMSLNLQAAIYLTKLVIPQMQVQKEGVIIYLASIAGVRGNKNLGLYGVSKAGIISLAKSLAVEFGPDNIRVNCISPGLIETPFSESLLKNEAFMQKRLEQTPLGRVGTVNEIAGVALMLASKAGGFITGQNIIVDGGTCVG